MWRSASTRKSVPVVSDGTAAAVIEDMAPLSAFHKRFVNNRQQEKGAAASSVNKQASYSPSALYLLARGSGTSAKGRSTAAQQASQEWSRLDGPTSVLALEPRLPVVSASSAGSCVLAGGESSGSCETCSQDKTRCAAKVLKDC